MKEANTRKLVSLLLATALVGCKAQDDVTNAVADNQGAGVPTQPTVANVENANADAAEPPAAPADDWAGEPDDGFYDACVLASFPTGGLVKIGEARTGDFVATISGNATGAWEAGDEGSFIYRVDKEDKLTGVTTSLAVDLRQTNTPPIRNAACGPRAVVVKAVAKDGQRATAMQTYAAVRDMARRAQRARDSGALGVMPYHEPASTDGDGPYTESIVSEQDAINRGVASEMGAAR